MDNPEALATLSTQVTGQRLEKTKGTIKNGQPRDTGNIGYTRHRTKTITKNTTQKTKEMSNTDPTKKPGVNPGNSD